MDIRRRFLSKKSSGGSSGGDSSGTYIVNLNDQWEKTTAVTNPDSSLYDGVYRSSSNYNVDGGASIMYITLTGYSTFKLYIRSYAESNYDYVMVSQLDKTIASSTSYSNTSLVKAHTRGNPQSGTALSSYTLVEYTGISSGSHTITIIYIKDRSVNSGDDRGYVLIPKSQGSDGESGGGDVDIDTTCSIMYTSSDGNVVTPYSTTGFGANITSNSYVNGQGIITFDGPVTKIGDSAFYNCDSLKSITIPDSVASIGKYAFNGCDSLANVAIGNSVTLIGEATFRYCSSLTSITIDNSVTSIGKQAFHYCSSLTSVTIGNSVTSIGNEAFSYCTSLKVFYGKFATSDNRCLIVDDILNSFAIGCGLTEYTIPSSVTSIGSYAFHYCESLTSITIPDSVTEIGNSAFGNCTSLKEVYYNGDLSSWCKIFNNSSATPLINKAKLYLNGIEATDITIPSEITEIKNTTFRGCTSLTSVTIPDSVASIGNDSFRDCDSLTSVTIPDSVTSIGEYAFYCCTSLTSITIPNNVTSIESYVFYKCTSLTNVTIGNSVTSIGYHAFENCSRLTSITIPDSVTSIGSSAFSGCTSLTSINIPNNITSIGSHTFYNCTSLTNVTIPDSVTEIGSYVFYGCTSLTSVTIPDSVTSIGNYAFQYCNSLASVYCKPTTPPTGGGSNIFKNNASDRTIYVPTTSVTAYKSAQYWSDYASNIVGYNF